jgi:hypothetical protein
LEPFLATGIVAWSSVFSCCFLPTRASTSKRLAEERIRCARAVFKNPQSILCGMIAGLLFIPTTIFDMIWGVRFSGGTRL